MTPYGKTLSEKPPQNAAPPERPARQLGERMFQFSLRMLKLCHWLHQRPGAECLMARRLFQVGAVVGSRWEGLNEGNSSVEFQKRCASAVQEMREVRYWLRLLVASELAPASRIQPLLNEAQQIARLLNSLARQPPTQHHPPP